MKKVILIFVRAFKFNIRGKTEKNQGINCPHGPRPKVFGKDGMPVVQTSLAKTWSLMRIVYL